MKTNFIPTLACLFILFAAGTSTAASTAKGVIIYTTPPSSYVEVCEYASLESGKPVYSTIVRADGQRLQLKTGGLWAVVNYPSSDPQAIKTEAQTALDTIARLISRYPQFRNELVLAQTKWMNAKAFADQVAVNTSKAESQKPKIGLTIGGVEYQDANLVSVDRESVGISHSTGVATIPLIKLTNEQIVALNTTSTSVRIDPDWAAKMQQKMAEEKQKQERANEMEKARKENQTATTKPRQKGLTQQQENISSPKPSMAPIFDIDRDMEEHTRNGEAIRARLKNESEGKLVVKGLFLGMQIDDCYAAFQPSMQAHGIYMIRDNRRSTNHTSADEDVLSIHIKGQGAPMDFAHYKGWGYCGEIKADPKTGLVYNIYFQPPLTNLLFNSADLDASEFSQTFIDSYGVLELKVKQSHGKDFWVYYAPAGWTLWVYPDKGIEMQVTPKRSFGD